MTRKEIAKELANRSNLTPSQATHAVEGIVEIIATHSPRMNLSCCVASAQSRQCSVQQSQHAISAKAQR